MKHRFLATLALLTILGGSSAASDAMSAAAPILPAAPLGCGLLNGTSWKIDTAIYAPKHASQLMRINQGWKTVSFDAKASFVPVGSIRSAPNLKGVCRSAQLDGTGTLYTFTTAYGDMTVHTTPQFNGVVIAWPAKDQNAMPGGYQETFISA